MAVRVVEDATELRATLGAISAFITKGATPTTYGFQWESSGVTFLRSECVSERGLDLRQSMYISEAANQALRRSQVSDGDLLVTITGNVGRVVRLAGVGVANINQHIARVRVKDPRFESAFVYHYLSQRVVREHYETIVTGQAFPQISLVQVRDTEVIGPSTEAQRAIARALDDSDELIAALERLIAKKQAIKQGMMHQLLTGKTRLPGFTDSWSVSTVGDVADVKTGPFGSALHERDYVPNGTPIITVEHLGERSVEGAGAPMVSETDRRRLRAYSLAEGDIVFSRVGSIDRSAMVSSNEAGWLFSGRLLRVRLQSSVADPQFMSAQFHSGKFTEAVRAVAVGQTMRSLNTAILNGVSVVIPPLDEQKAIGVVVKDLDHELDVLESNLEKARGVKRGMMQELLTGRTRLPIKEVAS